MNDTLADTNSNATCYPVLDNISTSISVQMPRATDVIKAALIGLTAFLIILGNLFCLVVLRLIRDAPVVSKIFMASLTTADLLNGALVVLPVSVSSAVNTWPVLTREFCYIHEIASSIMGVITVMCLFVVSIDRYISVSRPLRYETLMTKRVTLALVICVWTMPCLTRVAFTPYARGYKVIFRNDSDMCWLAPDDPLRVPYAVFLLVYIVLPFSATCIIYSKLFLIARRHTRCIASQLTDSDNHRNRRRPADHFRRNTKSAITFFLLTVTFTISWTPFVISWFYRLISKSSPSEAVVILIQISSFSNGWVNCLVYYIRNKVFQRTAKNLFRCPNRTGPVNI